MVDRGASGTGWDGLPEADEDDAESPALLGAVDLGVRSSSTSQSEMLAPPVEELVSSSPNIGDQ